MDDDNLRAAIGRLSAVDGRIERTSITWQEAQRMAQRDESICRLLLLGEEFGLKALRLTIEHNVATEQAYEIVAAYGCNDAVIAVIASMADRGYSVSTILYFLRNMAWPSFDEQSLISVFFNHNPNPIHWRGIGNHNHHLITPSDMEAWCAATGYTDPFHQEGRWWAFPPNGVMPVDVGQEVREWLKNQEQQSSRSLVSRLGLMPFEEFDAQAAKRSDYPRCSGRTTQGMLIAIESVLSGEAAAFVVHNNVMLRMVLNDFCKYFSRLQVEIDVNPVNIGFRIYLKKQRVHLLVTTKGNTEAIRGWYGVSVADHVVQGFY